MMLLHSAQSSYLYYYKISYNCSVSLLSMEGFEHYMETQQRQDHRQKAKQSLSFELDFWIVCLLVFVIILITANI